MANGPQINLDMNIFKQLIGDAQKFSEVLGQMNGQIAQIAQASQNMGQAMGSGLRTAGTSVPNMGNTVPTPPPILNAQGAPMAPGGAFNPFAVPNFGQINQQTAMHASRAEYAAMMQGAAEDASRDRMMAQQAATWSADPTFTNQNVNQATSSVRNEPISPGFRPQQTQLPINSLKVLTPQEQMQSLMHQSMTGTGITSLPQALDVQKYFKGDGAKSDIDSLNKLSETLSKKEDAGSKLIVEELRKLKDSLEKNQEVATTAIERYARAIQDAGSDPEKKAEAFTQLNNDMQRANTAKEQAKATMEALGGGGGDGDEPKKGLLSPANRGRLMAGAQIASAGLAAGRAVLGAGFDIYSGMEGRDISAERETYKMQAGNVQSAVAERNRFYNIRSAEDFVRSRGDVLFGMAGGSEFLGATGRRKAEEDAATESARELNLSRQQMNVHMADMAMAGAQTVAGAGVALGTGGVGSLMGAASAVQGAAGLAAGAGNMQSNEYYRLTQGGTAGGVMGVVQDAFGTASSNDVARRERERVMQEMATKQRERAQQMQDAGVMMNSQYIQGIQTRLDSRQQQYAALSQVGGYAVADTGNTQADDASVEQLLGTKRISAKYAEEQTSLQQEFRRKNKMQGIVTESVMSPLSGLQEAAVGALGMVSDRAAAWARKKFEDGGATQRRTKFQDTLPGGASQFEGQDIKNEFALDTANQLKTLEARKQGAMDEALTSAFDRRRGQMESMGANSFTRLGIGTLEANQLRNQMTQFTGAGGGQATRGQTVEMARLGMIGMGSSEQLLGNLSAVNQTTGGRQNLDELKKVMQEAVAAGFDRSHLAQQFISSAVNMTNQLGTTNVSSVAQQLGTSAGLLGKNGQADERSLRQAQEGMMSLNRFTGRTEGAVGAVKAISIFSSGMTLESGAAMLQDMNSQEMQSALEQVKSGDVTKMDPKIRTLYERNPNLRQTLERTLQSTGNVALGSMYEQFQKGKAQGGTTESLQTKIKSISEMTDKDARKEALRKLSGDLEIVATSKAGLAYGSGSAFLSQELERLGKSGDFDVSKKTMDEMKGTIAVPEEMKRQKSFERANEMITNYLTSGKSKTGDQFLSAMMQAEKQQAVSGFMYRDDEGKSQSISYADYAARRQAGTADKGMQVGFDKAKDETDLFNVSARLKAAAADKEKPQTVYLSGLHPSVRQEIVQAIHDATGITQRSTPSPSQKNIGTGKNIVPDRSK